MTRFAIILILFFHSVALIALAGGGKGDEQDQEEKETRPAQFTFITPLGTNGLEAPEIRNRFSLNILTGVNGGLDGVEFGGLVNVLSGDMKGVQFAGLANYVHRETDGMQMAGLANIGRSRFAGGQFAGLLNLSLDEGNGTQLAGLININRGPFEGFQGSGLANITTAGVRGFQIGGLVNYTVGDVSSGQVAGLVNVGTKNTSGVQLAGLISVSGEAHKGSQISGIANVAPAEVTGSQIAGIFNYTGKSRGLQIGLVNVADSTGGAQVGLISYAGNGLISLGAQSDETFQGVLTLKMGLKKFYNIYSVGVHGGESQYWAPGFGFGSTLSDKPKASLNLEGIVFNVNEKEWWTDELNMLVRLNANYHYKLSTNFSFYAGLSVNSAISQVRDAEGRLTGGSFTPAWTFYEHTGNKTVFTLYPGFNFGLQYQIK